MGRKGGGVGEKEKERGKMKKDTWRNEQREKERR